MARQGISPLIIGLIIVGILACGVFIYFQIAGGVADPEPPTELATAPPPPPPPPPPEPELELPPLDDSDDPLRSMIGALSSHPQLATWLAPKGLVRRFTAAVVDIANQESPRPHLEHLQPPGDFQVSETQGTLYIDRGSFARYDRLTEVFTSLDVDEGARLYRQLKPLFDEAYRDLGYPEGDFDDALARAIDRVLLTPIPAERLSVRRRVKNYGFTSPQLEQLSPVEKHLLRMGPSNARQVQEKLRYMRNALALGSS